MVYLGNFKDTTPDRIKRFEERTGMKVERKLTQTEPQTTIEKLTEMLSIIEELKRKAQNYDNIHVDQNFRVTNAELMNIQIKLDKVDVTGDDAARQLRKKGLIRSDEAADILMNKIHDFYEKCSQCLKL